jgi:hypothetical protein
MLRRTAAALHGALLWTQLSRRHDLDQGVYVLLMPEDDPELNGAALAHIDDLIADRRAQGIVLVSDCASPAPERVPGIIAVERWTSRRIDALISFYELYAISDRLLILSLTRPFGNGLHRLLDRQGVTTEDLACLGCLRLRGYGLVRA